MATKINGNSVKDIRSIFYDQRYIFLIIYIHIKKIYKFLQNFNIKVTNFYIKLCNLFDKNYKYVRILAYQLHKK